MPKTIKPLSDTQIDSIKSEAKEMKLFDGGGLHLRVHPSGGKWWRLKYRFEGKEKQLSLGTYPETSLDDARSKRDAARAVLRQGIDPGTLRKEEKARRKTEGFESERILSVRVTINRRIEILSGGNTVRLSWDEARFIADTLKDIVR